MTIVIRKDLRIKGVESGRGLDVVVASGMGELEKGAKALA